MSLTALEAEGCRPSGVTSVGSTGCSEPAAVEHCQAAPRNEHLTNIDVDSTHTLACKACCETCSDSSWVRIWVSTASGSDMSSVGGASRLSSRVCSVARAVCTAASRGKREERERGAVCALAGFHTWSSHRDSGTGPGARETRDSPCASPAVSTCRLSSPRLHPWLSIRLIRKLLQNITMYTRK